ncbi:Mannosyl-oligosaccharide 1,2-alpha-mannosidase MNS3 [Phytophthora ramorum]|uniref:Mannosyl-oligosaccharide 1,2-alpha-mannosidase MNS3 n=1 Tax=Phytophthora ramorum TaxID=164328 RepID=UPI0030AA9761|nr:Mannosyl-oligosaccharide 1,2-alpha-mannosidase MNS3 [Phytophthora ramorum]
MASCTRTRPKTTTFCDRDVESLMILHRVTGDDIYREHGRVIMEAFEKHSKHDECLARYTVDERGANGEFLRRGDAQVPVLLFSDADILALDEIVFNTEAHPFPV